MSLMSLFALSNAFAAKGKTESDATTGSSFRAMIWLIYGFFLPVIYMANEMWYVRRCKMKANIKTGHVNKSIVPRHLFSTANDKNDRLKTEFGVLKECSPTLHSRNREKSSLLPKVHELSEDTQDDVSQKKIYMVTMENKLSAKPPTSQIHNLIPVVDFSSQPASQAVGKNLFTLDTEPDSDLNLDQSNHNFNLSDILEKPEEELLEMIHSIPNGTAFESAISALGDQEKLLKLVGILVRHAIVLRKQWILKKRLTVDMDTKLSLLMEKFQIFGVRIKRLNRALKKRKQPIHPDKK
eukprot:TRINITY_DN1463_c2_g2_i1.p1 TRINITY_DN1463_c2_g2~~TRINITY_DN1463_c2_g2_i1.p1  ORF type:complete len:296 (+),score=49.01 TRINITY_DN1463_c2_g2_i1:124-1011(+)